MKPFFNAFISAFRNYSTKKPISKSITGNTKRPTKTEWTEQQLKVLTAVEQNKSVLITGSAGTGKTKLTEAAIRLLRKMHGPNGVAVTGSTGVVACALNGQTLHSFAGIGRGEADTDTLIHRVLSNNGVLKRWSTTEVLVIDEISMVSGELFDKLEKIARAVMTRVYGRSRADLPWGGMKIVASGDFFQLPPVIDDKNSVTKEFAFEADSWDCSFQYKVPLHKVFRQSDGDYIRLLNGIRKGELDCEGFKLLESRFCSSEDEIDDTVVRLFPRNKDVDRVNTTRLHRLGEEIIVYEAFDTGKEPWKSQLNQGIAPTTLELCKGARVILTKNINVKRKLVNGAAGTVTGFKREPKGKVRKIFRHHGEMVLPTVKFDSGCELAIKPVEWEIQEGDETLATRMQLPIMLAWAMSIHKSQGMTLDKFETDLSKAFGYEMVYAALSRGRSLDGLYLSGFRRSAVKAHPKVLEYYRKLADEQENGENFDILKSCSKHN